MKRVLLLNLTYDPLNFITEQKAHLLLMKQKAEIVANMEGIESIWPDSFLTTPTRKFKIPATLRLLVRVNTSRIRMPKFRKHVIFNRDKWVCQYCSMSLSKATATIDHVFPSSRGGKTTWQNCVASCKPCNRHKANKTPNEANMNLLCQPSIPTTVDFWDISRSKIWHNDWELFV